MSRGQYEWRAFDPDGRMWAQWWRSREDAMADLQAFAQVDWDVLASEGWRLEEYAAQPTRSGFAPLFPMKFPRVERKRKRKKKNASKGKPNETTD